MSLVCAAAADFRVEQERLIRPVGESAHDGQVRAVLHSPQQISPGGGRRLPELLAVEPAVGDDEHARPEIGNELPGQRTLADPPRRQPRGDDGMRSAFP